MKKYELRPCQGLYQLRALRNIPAFGVKAGDVGGLVAREYNLSHEGDAWVSDDARVFDNALVSGDARVSGGARVSGNRHLLTVGPLGSRKVTLTVHSDAVIGVRFSTGCFSGSREEFEAAVVKTHGDNVHGNAYAAVILLADLLVDPA